MLVLTRRLNESIIIGKDIEIRIVGIKGSGEQAMVRIGIVAPKQIQVLRKEVFAEVAEQNRAASAGKGNLDDLLAVLGNQEESGSKPSRE
ncbi:MAG: carbon storage regulator CsrA [Actinobacteria bacterium]|nr:carbon storage regulator CsrA [Actinomycetota bacterium]